MTYYGPAASGNPLQELSRYLPIPPGPQFLVREIRERIHFSISDEEVGAVLVPALGYLAMLARRNEMDVRAMGLETTGPTSWQDVCDWLVGIAGRFGSRVEVNE